MEHFIIQPARAGDIPKIRELASRIWYVTYREVHTREQLDFMFNRMYSPEQLQAQMNQGHQFYIGYENNIPFGYFAISRKDDSLFYLEKLYVVPEYHNKGAGKFLFHQAITQIKAIHPDPCMLELNVNRHNKAVRFYERMGMEITRYSDDEIGEGFVMNNCFMAMKICHPTPETGKNH